jgi:magnesium chelatase family protein
LVGELGLDGRIRPIRGGLAIAALGKRRGMRELLVPFDNAGEAAAIGALPVIPVTDLDQAMAHLTGVVPIRPVEGSCWAPLTSAGSPDLSEVRGQAGARRALEIAAAGGHNLLLIGPPGSGKTMLVRRLPGILPRLSHAESVAVTQIHSLAGSEPPPGLIRQRPLRSPHSTVSGAGLLGGGSIPRPGEVTLAHCGVLFLDELPEFRRDALEALRQPLEDGKITVVRARGRITFPARFSLVAAMNPCRCGHLGDPRHECRCTPSEVERYRSRISGPLLDRIDLHVEVPAVTLDEIREPTGETTAAVAERVQRARRLQLERLRFSAESPTNAALRSSLLRRHCRLEAPARKLVDTAFERLGLSARGLTRILKVSRTIADLAGHQRINAEDIAEAVQYRALDHRHRE